MKETAEKTPFDEQQTQALTATDDTMVVWDEAGAAMIASLTNRQTMFCSMIPTDEKSKAALFNAMNNTEKRLGDCINMTIAAKDLFVEVVELVNQMTGTLEKQPRVVIIDDKGVGYQCVSRGVFSALKKLIAIYGSPTWKNPLKLTVKQITKGEKKLLTFDVA